MHAAAVSSDDIPICTYTHLRSTENAAMMSQSRERPNSLSCVATTQLPSATVTPSFAPPCPQGYLETAAEFLPVRTLSNGKDVVAMPSFFLVRYPVHYCTCLSNLVHYLEFPPLAFAEAGASVLLSLLPLCKGGILRPRRKLWTHDLRSTTTTPHEPSKRRGAKSPNAYPQQPSRRLTESEFPKPMAHLRHHLATHKRGFDPPTSTATPRRHRPTSQATGTKLTPLAALPRFLARC